MFREDDSFVGKMIGSTNGVAQIEPHPLLVAIVNGTLNTITFGITHAPESQANIGFPGVIFIPTAEENAFINIVLAWRHQSEDPAVGRFIALMRNEAHSLCSISTTCGFLEPRKCSIRGHEAHEHGFDQFDNLDGLLARLLGEDLAVTNQIPVRYRRNLYRQFHRAIV